MIRRDLTQPLRAHFNLESRYQNKTAAGKERIKTPNIKDRCSKGKGRFYSWIVHEFLNEFTPSNIRRPPFQRRDVASYSSG